MKNYKLSQTLIQARKHKLSISISASQHGGWYWRTTRYDEGKRLVVMIDEGRSGRLQTALHQAALTMINFAQEQTL